MSSLIITLICVWPHYSSLHILWRSAGLCCCCCCEWCDVAVDLQTDKTQSSDTWWARCGAWECCLRPGGDTLNEKWYVQCKCVFWNLDALQFFKMFAATLQVSCQSEVSGTHLVLLYLWLLSVSSPVWPPWSVCSGQCWRLMRVTTRGHAPVWGPGSFPRCRAQCHSGAGQCQHHQGQQSCHVTCLMMSWSEHLQWQQWMWRWHHLLLSDEWPYNKCFLPGDSFVRLLQSIRWPSLSFKLSKFLSQSCFASPRISRDSPPERQSSCKPGRDP